MVGGKWCLNTKFFFPPQNIKPNVAYSFLFHFLTMLYNISVSLSSTARRAITCRAVPSETICWTMCSSSQQSLFAILTCSVKQWYQTAGSWASTGWWILWYGAAQERINNIMVRILWDKDPNAESWEGRVYYKKQTGNRTHWQKTALKRYNVDTQATGQDMFSGAQQCVMGTGAKMTCQQDVSGDALRNQLIVKYAQVCTCSWATQPRLPASPW